MAKLIDDISRNGFALTTPIDRQNAVPTDTTYMYENINDAKAYAKNGATAYVGQVIYVKPSENDIKGKLYIINNYTVDPTSDDYNDDNFLTEIITNANDYYTADKIDELINSINTLNIEVKDADFDLSKASPEDVGKLIFVPEKNIATGEVYYNSYSEYVCYNNGTSTSPSYKWEKIGSSEIDLSGYALSTHNHDDSYSALNHNHDDSYYKLDTLKVNGIDDSVIKHKDENNTETSDYDILLDEDTFKFKSDLKLATALGRYDDPSNTADGYHKITSTGKSFLDVWKDIFATGKEPTVTQPSISIVLKQNDSTICNQTFEIGTSFNNVKYTIITSSGTYQYGPATDVSFSDYSVTKLSDTSGTTPYTPTTIVNQSYETITIKNENQVVTVSAKHSAGATPYTSLKENSTKTNAIAEKTISNTATISAGAYYTYYGYTNEKTLSNIDFRNTGSDASKKMYYGGKSFITKAPSGSKTCGDVPASHTDYDIFVIAIPQVYNLTINKFISQTSETIYDKASYEANPTTYVTSLQQPQTIAIKDAGGNNVNYDVWVYDTAVSATNQPHFNITFTTK